MPRIGVHSIGLCLETPRSALVPKPKSMAKKKKTEVEEQADPGALYETSAEDVAKAKKWFTRAKELGEKRNFEHAIEYYISGLEFQPDAVEEGLKPLHGCAVARKSTGGKKPGLRDTMSRSMNDKDPKTAYVNSLWLFGKDPDNAQYIEGVVKNGGKLRVDEAVKWAARVMLKNLESNAKSGTKPIQTLANEMEAMAERAEARGDVAFGVEALEIGCDAYRLLTRRNPKDQAAEKAMRSMSTRLTILKGKYSTDGGSFRDSVQDSETQRDEYDKERSITSDERMGELVAKAEASYREDPSDQNLKEVVNLLIKRENDAEETKAVELLTEKFEDGGEYRWKMLADDIRMKQLGRAARRATKAGDIEDAKKKAVEKLKFELGVFKERTERYPTDLRMKFELAVRMFQAGQFDEAIPLFQAARNDPKNKSACAMYLGRCFFRKNYFTQAIPTLRDALEAHPFRDDDVAKEMFYWLGRSQEAAEKTQDADSTYGELLQLDYNYRDVRERLDKLHAEG